MKGELGKRMPIGKVVVNAAKVTAHSDDKQQEEGKIIADKIDTAGNHGVLLTNIVSQLPQWQPEIEKGGLSNGVGRDMHKGEGSRGLD